MSDDRDSGSQFAQELHGQQIPEFRTVLHFQETVYLQFRDVAILLKHRNSPIFPSDSSITRNQISNSSLLHSLNLDLSSGRVFQSYSAVPHNFDKNCFSAVQINSVRLTPNFQKYITQMGIQGPFSMTVL